MRDWREWGPAIAALAMIAVVVVLCLLAGSSSGARLRSSVAFGSSRTLIADHYVDAVIGAGGNDVILALQRRYSGPVTLELLNTADRRVLARRFLGGGFGGLVDVQGSDWMVTTAVNSNSAQLWRLDPATLAVRSRRTLPGPRAKAYSAAITAVGSLIWVNYGGHLARVDPVTGALSHELHVAGAGGLAADPDRGGLVVSVGNDRDGAGWIERRDPVSGALEATSREYHGVTEPELGGIADGRVWLTESTGLEGYVQELSLRTLRPLRTLFKASQPATNEVRAEVVGGSLFISEPGPGGPAHNFCASAATGAPRARLPVAAQRGNLLAVDGQDIFFIGPTSRHDPRGSLLEARIPAACGVDTVARAAR